MERDLRRRTRSLSPSHLHDTEKQIQFQVPPVRRFSKRLLMAAALFGCFIGWYIFPMLFGRKDLERSFFSTPDILRSLFEKSGSSGENDVGAPGEMARAAGWKAHYPVLIIPGLTSTGLEVWQAQSCASSHFRERLWGTTTMLKFLLFDKKCWLKHVALDLDTGLDPQDIKLRAALGLAAADFLVPGYWVFGPMIESLGQVGYDPAMLTLASYDWRLQFCDLENRDRFFSVLKASIETNLLHTQKKTVVICHSLGSLVFLYFMNWINSDTWVDTHIHAFINIGGPLLGVPKTISSLISGDMKDTVQLGVLESMFLEAFLSRRERAFLFRRWPGLLNMLPKGGALWDPTLRSSREEEGGVNDESGHPPVITIEEMPLGRFKHWSIEESLEILEQSSLLPPQTASRIPKADALSDPLRNPLPNAPNMTLYSFYGVGKETEVAYEYRLNTDVFGDMEMSVLQDALARLYGGERLDDEVRKVLEDFPGIETFLLKREHCRADISYEIGEDTMSFPLVIDRSKNDPSKRLRSGVYTGDGDGTVPILSLGYMGLRGWKSGSKLNPHGVKIVTREYLHEPVSILHNLRGGPKSADHTDILGNNEITFDILRVVCARDIGAAETTTVWPEEPVSPDVVLCEGTEDDLGNSTQAVAQQSSSDPDVLYEQGNMEQTLEDMGRQMKQIPTYPLVDRFYSRLEDLAPPLETC